MVSTIVQLRNGALGIGALLIVGQPASAAPVISILPASAFQAQCGGDGSPEAEVMASVRGLAPLRRYELLVLKTPYEAYVANGRRSRDIAASAYVFTGRQQRDQYRLTGLWPGTYTAVLIERGQKTKLAQQHIAIAPPNVSVVFPSTIAPNTPFDVTVARAVGVQKRSQLYLAIGKLSAPFQKIASPVVGMNNIPTCEQTKLTVKGLPAGVYRVRLYENRYRGDDPLHFEQTLSVGTASSTVATRPTAPTTPQPTTPQPIMVQAPNPFPLFNQLDARDARLYASQGWAETNELEEDSPRVNWTCLATVYAMIEHARGNTSYRIGPSTYQDFGGGAQPITGVGGSSSNIEPPEFDAIHAQITAGNPVILRGNSARLGVGHYMLAVGIDTNNRIITLDPYGGKEVRVSRDDWTVVGSDAGAMKIISYRTVKM